jgi:hypothetical protein
MAESKSVVIRLTNEQREAIKRATGKDITELKVDALEGRFSPMTVEARKAPFVDEARKAPGGLNEERKAPFVDEARKAPGGLNEERKAPSGITQDED